MTVAVIRPRKGDQFSAGLFARVDHNYRMKLATSEFGRLQPGEKVVDLFCGGGGWGAGAKRLGIKTDYAVNHWDKAIETHKKNNPDCVHHQGDAWRAKPRKIVGKDIIGLLLASAACTTHSRARGSAPISKRVHMLGYCIIRWMKETKPRAVEVENVPEWVDWGPLIHKSAKGGVHVWERRKIGADKKVKWRTCTGPRFGTADGARFRRRCEREGFDVRPVRIADPARKGKHFRAWWRAAERLGYKLEMRILDAPDFGAGSRRKRLFIKCRRDGAPILWPAATHGPRGSGLKPYKTAAECIDFSDLGTSIFDRSRPLKPKTLARICGGVDRHVLKDANPFLLRVSRPEGGGWHIYPIDGPMPTQTARQDVAMATPVVTKLCQNGSNGLNANRPDQPLGGQTTAQEYGLATPVVQLFRGDVAGLDPRQPLPTITAGNGPGRGAGAAHALGVATPILATTGYGERKGQAPRVHQVSDLLGTVVNGAKQALVTPIMIGAGGSGYAGKPVRADQAMGTVKTDDRRALVCPILAPQNTDVIGQRPDRPGPTITSKGHQAIISPVLMHNTTGHSGARVDGSAPTVTTGGQTGLVAPLMTYYRHGGGQSSDVREPLGTVTAGGNHALLVAALLMSFYSGGGQSSSLRGSMPAMTTLDRHGLVVVTIGGEEMVIVDILFRMLRPHELAAAMGFPQDMWWPDSQRDTVKLIGNAVNPDTAEQLIASTFPGGRSDGRRSLAS